MLYHKLYKFRKYLLLLFLFGFAMIKMLPAQNYHKIDSLQKILAVTVKDSLRATINLLIGDEFGTKNEDSILLYYNTALKFSQKNKILKIEHETLFKIGNHYRRIGDYPLAITYILNALTLAEQTNNYSSIGYYSNHIGMIYHDQKSYELAFEYYQKALDVRMKHSALQGASYCLSNIGSMFEEKGDFKKAKEYYLQALNLRINLYDSIQKTSNEDFIKRKVDKQREVFNLRRAIAHSYLDLGSISMNDKQVTVAYRYYIKAQTLARENNITDAYSSSCIKLADYSNKTGNYAAALNYENEALEIIKRNKLVIEEKNVYELMSKTYEGQNNFPMALQYFKLFKNLSDSVINTEKNNKISELSVRFQTTKKEQQLKLNKIEIEKQNLDIEKNKSDIRQARIQQIAMIGALLFIGIISIVIFINYKNKKKANQLLTEKNIEINQQKEEIETQSEVLSRANMILKEQNEEINQQKEEILTQAEQLSETNIELEKLSIVASKTDNAVKIANSDGIIEWINKASVKLYGSSITNFIGKSFSELYSNKDLEIYFSKCINEKISVRFESHTIFESKGLFTQTTLSPVIDSEGNILKIVAIDSDITEIRNAKDLMEKQNTQILDSINFAKLIQEAILPTEDIIKLQIPELFIFFQPKDIVSGDFYWMYQKDNLTFLALADCTGHGVPGAFMSMIGNALLNEIVKWRKIYDPVKIFKLLNNEINSMLNQSGQNYDAGMDLTICCIDKDKKAIKLGLSGQTAYYILNGEITEIVDSYTTIGGILSDRQNSNYTILEIENATGMTMYLTSDGYTDQYGGPDNKKFNHKSFKQMLVDISPLDMTQQKEVIVSTFENWKGNSKQVDDITVIGFKLLL